MRRCVFLASSDSWAYPHGMCEVESLDGNLDLVGLKRELKNDLYPRGMRSANSYPGRKLRRMICLLYDLTTPDAPLEYSNEDCAWETGI